MTSQRTARSPPMKPEVPNAIITRLFPYKLDTFPLITSPLNGIIL